MGTNKGPAKPESTSMKTDATYETNETYVSDWTRIIAHRGPICPISRIRRRHAGLVLPLGSEGHFTLILKKTTDL
jgi:hypothetical protein